MSDDYRDILHLPRHVSKTRKKMSNYDRAAQFSPFAALTGYDAAIREEGRRTVERRELAEDEKRLLDRKYRYLSDHPEPSPEVTLTRFSPDQRKAGGSYVTLRGRVAAISSAGQWLALEGGERIPFRDIRELEIPGYEEY